MHTASSLKFLTERPKVGGKPSPSAGVKLTSGHLGSSVNYMKANILLEKVSYFLRFDLVCKEFME